MTRHSTRTGAAPLTTTTVDCSRLGVVDTVAWTRGEWCLQCCHPFVDNNVVLIPTGTNAGEWYGSDGAFCNYPCARRYVWEHYNDRRNELFLHLGMAARKNGVKDDDGRMAPLRRELKVFGGDLTVEEYRASTEVGKVCVAWTPRVSGGAVGFPSARAGGGGALRQQQMQAPPTSGHKNTDHFQQYVGREKQKSRAKRPRSTSKKGPLSAFFKKAKQ